MTWYCPTCDTIVPPESVTYEGAHDTRCGGCGNSVSDGDPVTIPGHTMNDKILRWLFIGQVGASSKAMVAAVTGMPGDDSHPWDPDDLNRCLLLLVAVPEIRNHMDRVAAISLTWARLVEHWEALERCFLDEAGLNWCHSRSAPRTWAMMRRILEAA